MVTENSMELENQAFLSNQDITGEAPKLLLCSSIASGSDLGSNEGITPMAGIGKEYPEMGRACDDMYHRCRAAFELRNGIYSD